MAFDESRLSKYTKELTLLFADDSKTARTFIKSILEPYFKEITVVEDGDIALKAFNERRHDIIITDINMPNLNGIEVARFVRKISPSTPIIVTTSFSEESNLIECIKIGVNGYIKKSANPEELLQAVFDSAKIKFQEMELEKNQQIMLQQSKLSSMGELLVNIAHQWRQPINYMALTIQELKDAYEMGELDGEYLQDVTSSTMKFVTSMSKTIDEFSTYFQPETDKEEFVVLHAVQHALSMQHAEGDESIKIKMHIPEELTITGYKKSFIQTMMHLIKNAKEAIQHSDPELKLIIIKADKVDDVETHESRVRVEICDTGGGMTEEALEKMYDPYFTTHFQSSGKGLGLYVSKITVEEYLMGRLSGTNHSFSIGGKPFSGACFTVVI